MANLLEQLQNAIGHTYRLDRELGGGGMSRVFVAEELALSRSVVIKVLPPEMSAAVNKDRFNREIQLAASLQHPHVVPLLTAGTVDDMLYYVMPFIEGESLRARLERDGDVPAAETAKIMRDVADALSAAHKAGVVHRDIKPGNVLLSGNHALVTDFGVAKAVSARGDSSGSSALTTLGIALGTPAYMAPEQAAADPNTDHRADIYALGIVAYEMLAGQPPFPATTPQEALAAHISQPPEPITNRCPDISPLMAEVVMRCLEKKPADRWQSAEELVPNLEALKVATGAVTPAGTLRISAGGGEAPGTHDPARVAVLFLAASAGVLILAFFLMMQLGLPGWVLPASVALLAAGLPVMFLTHRVETHRARVRSGGQAHLTPPPLGRWLTWRKAWTGGVAAFASLGVFVAVYMAMRLLGIGPVGTLVASGVLDRQERIILADFDNSSSDSTLGESVTELFRIDLAQSPAITVIEPRQVGIVLRRMERDADAALDEELAREVAEREGLKAIVSGDVRSVGSGYVISARIVAAGEGEVLAAARETAAGPDQIVGAVDRLSADLRERIGESLLTIRADAPLARVTTRSTEALRKYALADRANNRGNSDRAIALLNEALAEDSTFAMGYRKLGVVLGNVGRNDDSANAMLRKAFELRDRLTERERYHAEAIYAYRVDEDVDATIAAYRAILETYPNDAIALNNISLAYQQRRLWDEAAAVTQRSIQSGDAPAATYENGMIAQYAAGRVDDARDTHRQFSAAYPENPGVQRSAAAFASSERDYDRADSILAAVGDANRDSELQQMIVAFSRSSLAFAQGKRSEGYTHWREGIRLNVSLGRSQEAYLDRTEQAQRAWDDLWFGVDPTAVVRRMDAILAEYPLSAVPVEDRPYFFYASIYSRAGAPDQARSLLDEYRREVDSAQQESEQEDMMSARAHLALAEGRPEDALPLFRDRERESNCSICWAWELGDTHQRAGDADSALAYFESYVNTPWLHRAGIDSRQLPAVLLRLAELYEARGDGRLAADYYGQFLELWKDADPDLQATVDDVRGRVGRIASEPVK